MFENAPSVASHLALRRKDLPKKLGHHVETRAPEARGSVLRYRGISNAHPVGPPQGSRHTSFVGSYGGALSYERGTPVVYYGKSACSSTAKDCLDYSFVIPLQG